MGGDFVSDANTKEAKVMSEDIKSLLLCQTICP